jgi:hypothetical protein
VDEKDKKLEELKYGYKYAVTALGLSLLDE